MTLLEIATLLLVRDGKPVPTEWSMADLDALNLPMFAGCQGCGESLGAYNAHPQHNGFISCKACSAAPIATMAEWDALAQDDNQDDTQNEPNAPPPEGSRYCDSYAAAEDAS